jgi:multidrug resistance efflux pump
VAGLPPIRTPWRQHWRRVRYQLAPVVIFAGAVVLAGWLWGRHVGLPNAVGEVYAVRVDVASPVDGEIIGLPGKPLALFDEVRQGQLVALLDDRAALALLSRMQDDLSRLNIDLETTILAANDRQVSLKAESLREARGLALDIEKLRLGIVERQGLVETDKVELDRLVAKCDAVRPLVEKGIEAGLTLLDLEMQRDVVKQRIEANRRTLSEAETQKAAGDERMKSFPAVVAERLLASREVRAPIGGTVTAIYSYPGQNIAAGGAILTIAGAESQCILSYVREGQRVRPAVGMSVSVQARTIPRDTGWASIERVGPQIEPVPPHHLRDPKVPEWGLPVRIPVPAGLKLRPGELVDIAFNRVPDEAILPAARRRAAGGHGM